MKNWLARGLMTLAFVLLVFTPTYSYAALTESQISAILSLLQSFGAEQSVINNVNASLRGQAPGNSGSTPASNGCQYIGQLNRTLYEGLSGPDVSALQRFLQAQGVFTHPEITSYFGPATESAVQRWQAQHGVVSSGTPNTTGYGVVGALTRAAFARNCGYASTTETYVPSTTNETTLSRDARRIADIKQLQLALELYMDSNGEYPSSLSLLSPSFITYVPVDPLDKTAYLYSRQNTGYEIAANLETANHSALSTDSDTGAKLSGVDYNGCYDEVGRYCYDIRIDVTSSNPEIPSLTISLNVTPEDHDTFVANINVGQWTYYTYEIDWGEGDSSTQTTRSRFVTVCNSEWTCRAPAGVVHTYGSPGYYTINVYAIKGDSRVRVATASARSGTGASPLPTPVINSFTASPSSLTYGQSSTLSWNATNTADGGCYIFNSLVPGSTITQSNNWGGSGSQVITPVQTLTYTLWCTSSWKDGSPTATKTLTVSVEKPTTYPSTSWVDIKAAGVDNWDNSATLGAGTSVLISWTSSGVETCNINSTPATSSITGKQGVTSKGLSSGPLSETTTFSIQCTAANGQVVSDSVKIVVVSASTAGPKYNARSCSNPAKTGAIEGALACYGLWDYGDAFGNDQNMCDTSPYGTPTTGCKVTTNACSSGKATATKYYSMSSASISDIQKIADNLLSTPEVVKAQLVRVWEYTCDAPAVSTAKESIVVGVYEGSYPSGVSHSGGYHPEGTVTINIIGGSASNVGALVLTAYEPVNWVISNPENIPLPKIIAVGYYNQRVTGAGGASVEYHSYQSDGVYQYAYQTTDSAYTKLANWLSGKGFPINHFIGNYNGNSFNVFFGLKG